MLNEQIIENGTVTKIEGDFLTIAVKESQNCDDCSAKLFCSGGFDGNRNISVVNKYDYHPGDKVEVSLPGSALLKIAWFIYGIPLVLFIAVLVLVFYNIGSENAEFYSFVSAILVTFIYYTAIKSTILKNNVFNPYISSNKIAKSL